MNAQELLDSARGFVASDKGPLAMDESNQPATKDLPGWGVARRRRPRRAYRQLIMTTRDLGECICVVILCDETIHHPRKGGIPLVKIISPEGSVAGVAGS